MKNTKQSNMDLKRLITRMLAFLVVGAATLLIGAASTFGQQAGGSTPASSLCKFHPVNKTWQGSCGKLIFDVVSTLTIAPADKITTGIWRKGVNPTSVWAGETESGSDGNWPIEVEIYEKGKGVLRSEYGWFPISEFTVTPEMLSFQMDTSKPVAPNELDRKIVERASSILSSDSVWNRADNRKCAETDKTFSIYCAVERASVEVVGGFNHRRPALELVRQIVDERSAGRNYEHRLMDYNNDPSTKLADVQTLFAEALKRMSH